MTRILPPPILTARNIVKSFATGQWEGWKRKSIRAVDAVDLEVREGETLAIVGESGSGKSSLARILLGLVPPTSGEILYRGKPIETLNAGEKRVFRREIQPVFQDPASSLNPRMRVETTLGHVLARHGLATPATMRSVIAQRLESVGLTPATEYLDRYPHQLSGGQQQRIAIARAIALEPKLVIADEPLSSLDMSVQAQILDLLIGLKRRLSLGMVMISHDLNVVATIADRVAVMYLGQIVEIGPAADVLGRPQHAYTRSLLAARLTADPRLARSRAKVA